MKMHALAIGAAMTATLLLPPGAAAGRPPAAPAPPTPADAPAQAALANPDASLGANWQRSTDQLVTGVGDSLGFHLYRAREKDAFAWSRVATLNAGVTEAGAWSGSVCVTGSGNYAVAVYAPSAAANKPALMNGGAFAAVVNLNTGAAARLPERVQFSYFNPACGPTDRVLLTRPVGIEMWQTDLITVDAATARITATRRIRGQLTTPAPGPEADYGIAHGDLVRIRPNGTLTTVGTPGGRPAAVRVTAAGAVDLVTVQRVNQAAAERAVAYRYVGRTRVRIGEAAKSRLDLVGLAGGRDALVGDLAGVHVEGLAGITAVSTDRRPQAVSSQGHLVALELRAGRRDIARAGALPGTESLGVTVQATATGQVSHGTVVPARLAMADAAPGGANAGLAAVPNFPPAVGNPTCAVPRNDVHRQALQPSANQVEWAVDLAVQGKLTVQRPANYAKAGMPAYQPQVMFKLPTGAPRVPAQVMLAILAQETNMAQATWHAVPGDPGNPLIADYYGIWADPQQRNEQVDFSHAECGYGIAQITDGMKAGQSGYTAAQQVAIATDYAANIAAGLQILAQKYLEVRAAGITLNDDEPSFIENWYVAVWAYNSGVHPKNGSQPYGIGWFNNPANPIYDPQRQPFLRASLDDSSTPNHWSYPERIMGWAETPQWQWIDPLVKYAAPTFGSSSNGQLSLPDIWKFCEPLVNHCTPQLAAPCPSVSDLCWWHGNASWLYVESTRQLATETLTYPVGSSEPALIRRYPAACTPFPAKSGLLVVDDLTDSSNNLLCAGQSWGGKFTLRLGSPAGSTFSEYTKVDLHQMPGYLGHAWFTHAYDPATQLGSGRTADNYHRVVGTWTPNVTAAGGQLYDIVAHLPSHGANITYANYIIKTNDPNGTLRECAINQQYVTDWQDHWVYLGSERLYPGARVQLSNMVQGQDGTVDVGYDAIAFSPLSSGGHSCADPYPS